MNHLARMTKVLEILLNPFAGGREWSFQGFGMFRTYLDCFEKHGNRRLD